MGAGAPERPWTARLAAAFLGGDIGSNASLGMVLVATCTLIVACTVESVNTDAHGMMMFLVAFAASVVVALPAWRLRWAALPSRALLVFPAIVVVTLVAASALVPGVGGEYGSFFLLCFVYVGLTQPPWTSAACAVVALPAWAYTEGHFSTPIDIKMPITILLWVLVGELLSQRVRSHARTAGVLAVAASTDHLTGLLSRRELDQALGGAAAGDAVVMIDLDRFKRVNDERGHLAGDRVLADFGRTVLSVARSGDVALRYGGDEVLLVLTRAGLAGSETFLDRLRTEWAGAGDRPTFSAGVAVQRTGEVPTETLRRADRALYVAKHGGGDRLEHADAAGRQHS